MECVTNKRFLDLTRPCAFVKNIPDKLSFEASNKNEWRLRCYYEAKKTVQNGFVLFDTLTEHDSYLNWYHDIDPRMIYNCWDYPCFSIDRLQNFFKSLRDDLDRAGYDVDKHLKYFLVGEYGDVTKTYRPHYHVLFFVSFSIDPCVFSSFVSANWKYGKTDGIRPYYNCNCVGCPCVAMCNKSCLYQDKNYVLSKRVFKIERDCLKITNYLLKYLYKNYYWHDRLNRRAYYAFVNTNGKSMLSSYQGRLLFRRFKRNILPFKLVSEHFGECCIDYIGKDKIINDGVVTLPVNDKGSLISFPVPQYIKRKIMYDCVNVFGRYQWRIKREFLSKFVDFKFRSINRLALKFMDFDNKISFGFAFDCARYYIKYYGTIVHYHDQFLSDRDFLMKKFSSDIIVENGRNLPFNVYYNNCNDHGMSDDLFIPKLIMDKFKSGKSYTYDLFLDNLPFGYVYPDDDPSNYKYVDFICRYHMYLSMRFAVDLSLRQKLDYQKYRYKDIQMLK